MAVIFKKPADFLEFFAAVTGGSETFYSWFVDHTPSLLPSSLDGFVDHTFSLRPSLLKVDDLQPPQSNVELQLQSDIIALQFFQNGADVQFLLRPTDAPANVPTPALGITSQATLAGTPGADVFPLDIGTVMAAVAPLPALVQISGYSAAQGDVVDLSAVLRGSYAPLTGDSAQVRVTEDAGNAFATLNLNVGTAQSPHWVTLAKLDGVQAGDTVSVALDAAHTIALQSTLLA